MVVCVQGEKLPPETCLWPWKPYRSTSKNLVLQQATGATLLCIRVLHDLLVFTGSTLDFDKVARATAYLNPTPRACT